MKQIDLKSSEVRRLPRYDRWVLAWGCVGCVFAIVLGLGMFEWDLRLVLLGLPFTVIGIVIGVLFHHVK